MAGAGRLIAVISPNEAFSAIVGMVMQDWHDLTVTHFSDSAALALSGLQPIAIVCNFEFGSGFYETFAPHIEALRAVGAIATVATVRSLDSWTRIRCVNSGIDEVLIKPISPLHLAERIATLAGESEFLAKPKMAVGTQMGKILPFARKASGAALLPA